MQRWLWRVDIAMPGYSTNLDNSREGPTVLAVGAGGAVWTCLLLSDLQV